MWAWEQMWITVEAKSADREGHRIGEPDLSRVPGLIQSSYVEGTGSASVLYRGNDWIRWAPYGGAPARHSAVHR